MSLHLVMISLCHTGLTEEALCVGLRLFACFCAPVLPVSLPISVRNAASGPCQPSGVDSRPGQHANPSAAAQRVS